MTTNPRGLEQFGVDVGPPAATDRVWPVEQELTLEPPTDLVVDGIYVMTDEGGSHLVQIIQLDMAVSPPICDYRVFDSTVRGARRGQHWRKATDAEVSALRVLFEVPARGDDRYVSFKELDAWMIEHGVANPATLQGHSRSLTAASLAGALSRDFIIMRREDQA